MLRRIISSILVFAVLGYGTGWAFSGHALEIADHTAVSVHENSQAAPDEDGCDHCCHAAAHMTGMAPPIQAFRHPGADSFRLASGCTAATLTSAPPLKPPRS